MKISTIIITYNEERNIKKCIESVKEISDEIIVVDSFSTDRTEEIAISFGVNFSKNPFAGYIEQKNHALSLAKFDYVLNVDADEVLSNELKKSIVEVKKNPGGFEGYDFNRLTNFCGQWIRHCGWYPDTKLRLFKRESGYFTGKNPHDRVEFRNDDSKIKHLEGDLLHYSYKTLTEHIHQINRFSTIGAHSAKEKGKKVIPVIHIFGNPIFTFIKKYFFQLGMLDGYYGFIISLNTAYSKYLKYIKLRELNLNKEI